MPCAECPVCGDRQHHRGEVVDVPPPLFLPLQLSLSPSSSSSSLLSTPLSSTSLYYFTCPPPILIDPRDLSCFSREPWWPGEKGPSCSRRGH